MLRDGDGRLGMTAVLAALTACGPAADTASGSDKRPVEGQAPGEPLDADALQDRRLPMQPPCVKPLMRRKLRFQKL